MFSKFSEDAQKVLMDAKKEMQDLKHKYVGSEHLFLSLLKNNIDFIDRMQELGITYDIFKEKLLELVGIGNEDNKWFIYTPLLKRIIETAQLISKESSNNEVTSIHLIYAMFEEDEGIALKIISNLGVCFNDLENYYSKKIINKRKGSKKKLIIDEYGIDLNKKAENNELDPVIGREKELKKLIEILCRRTKNNPLLIGDAGVGKTALVEELAQMIVSHNVPKMLLNKRIISVSIASLVAGTKYRGEFEERINKMLKELEECDDVFLFIDEIHTIMGAGGAEGAIDAANIFKPALARGKIRLIGATTIDEYKKTIEKDKAMERRFQNIEILEPDNDNVLLILKELRPIYEKYHGVLLSDECLKTIIELSNRYIFDRKQPDKSIDIMDLVSSRISINKNNKIDKLDTYRKELVKIEDSKNNYLINQDYENASKIKIYEKELLTKINKYEMKNSIKNSKNIVTINDIYKVVSEVSHVPINEIKCINKKYVYDLFSKLHKAVVGQDQAINKLIDVTKKIKYGLNYNDKPYSFLFVGPTGVGKTKLALEYGKFVFNNNIIKINLSEYKDISSINKLIGSHPGYIGYDDYNNVFEKLRNKPYSLIILDEIEKAHPAILNLFLQILDDGKIEDNKGNTIYFNNTVIIMTSNLGYGKDDIGFVDKECKDDSKIKEFMSIELLNRIKSTIYFKKMEYNDIFMLIKMKINNIKKIYKSKDIKIHIPKGIINNIISECRYEEFGARKIDYILETNIDSIVIDNILNGKKEIFI